MTSEERKEARYWRRKRARELSKILRSQEYSNPENVFGTSVLIESFNKCTKTNGWKKAVQQYKSNLLVNSAMASKELKSHQYKNKPFKKFRIVERGHEREVQSLAISDMVVQGSFRDNLMHPIIRPLLIHDNGACLSGKGTRFALNRFVNHLTSHVRKFGRKGYIFFFDFKSFFKSIDKEFLGKQLEPIIRNKVMFDYFKQFTYGYCDEGLSLGSSISQICAVFYPNRLDHFIKDELRIKGYGRYMDDGYILCESKEKLVAIRQLVEEKCNEIGIILNQKKCKIVKLTRKFKWLKVRFCITITGKVIRRVDDKSNTIERRRLRKFKELVDKEVMSFREALLYFHSWLCSRTFCKCFTSNLSIVKYFNSLFSNHGFYYPPKVKTRRQKVLRFIAKEAYSI